MATIHCRCGEIFSDGSIPCEYEYHLLPNVAIDSLADQVSMLAREGEDPADINFAILRAATHLYKCPHCGRLIVFWDGLEYEPRFYKPE